MPSAADEAVALADAGDTEGADEVLVEAAIEAAVIEETADEIAEELVAEAAVKEAAIVEEERADDPFRGPGDWYVVHTYAGYENKVKANLESRIHTMQMEGKIFRVHIPMEDVMEIKSGKKQVVQKKVFPGYLLVKMVYDNDSWYVVRNTPGVTGFVVRGHRHQADAAVQARGREDPRREEGGGQARSAPRLRGGRRGAHHRRARSPTSTARSTRSTPTRPSSRCWSTSSTGRRRSSCPSTRWRRSSDRSLK